MALALLGAAISVAQAQTPYATQVITYAPAPGQFVNDPVFNDPTVALGWPGAGDPNDPSQASQVTLGGFGGEIVLAFDHTVLDEAANPFGLDAIVYSNALFTAGNPNRRWAEPGVIEISRDANGNGAADDAWYLIPGSHITPPEWPADFVTTTWDDDLFDDAHPPRWPPADDTWLPPGMSGVWTTSGHHLPLAVFGAPVLENPLGPAASREGVFGYADCTPTAAIPPNLPPELFYTRPDNPFAVGLSPGSGGGDAFDIAAAVDPITWQPADLDGFDFIRIRTALDVVYLNPPLGEKSTEIDAVVDVAPGMLGDSDNDGDVDIDDFELALRCWSGPAALAPPAPCRVLDFDQDGDHDLHDHAAFATAFTGEVTP